MTCKNEDDENITIDVTASLWQLYVTARYQLQPERQVVLLTTFAKIQTLSPYKFFYCHCRECNSNCEYIKK